jgi:hypothetical protein
VSDPVAGAPMPDPERYREQGFVLSKGFFGKDEIARIHHEAKTVFALQMVERGVLGTMDVGDAEFEAAMYRFFELDLQAFTNCGKQVQHLISLHRLSLDDRILQGLQALGLGFPNISTRPVLSFNARRLATKEVYWRLSVHQDWRSMQGSLDAVVVWIPLVDVDRSLGALEIIPDSHRWGLLEAEFVDGYGHVKGPIDTSAMVAAEVERGDALFFSAFLVHRSGTNTTGSIRWSCHFRYNNLREATFIERGFPHPYLYRPQETLITSDFPTAAAVARTFEPRD